MLYFAIQLINNIIHFNDMPDHNFKRPTSPIPITNRYLPLKGKILPVQHPFKKYAWILLIILVAASGKQESKSTDIYSYQFRDQESKLMTIKNYLHESAGVSDAIYHIWVRDDGTGKVPKPIDCNITVALSVHSDSLDRWVKHLKPSSKKISLKQWGNLNLDREKWKLDSEAELYHSCLSTEVKLLFREENIVLGIYPTRPINLEYIEEQRREHQVSYVPPQRKTQSKCWF
ncbi:MAG: hypothetical protein JKY42_11075 [Flavobacteriales bacterium]|nr:hypothetical protein [Flavobacteriales bacterium]